MNEIRLKRMENLLMEKLSIIILQGKIKDPRVDSSVSITRIKISKDFSSARLWVSSFGGADATSRASKGLNNASGFIQSIIGRELRTKHTPKLSFHEDHSIRAAIVSNQAIERAMGRLK